MTSTWDRGRPTAANRPGQVPHCAGAVAVALVGCGAIAELAHAPALTSLTGEARVVAAVDPLAERRDLLGGVLEVPAGSRYAKLSAMLENEPGLDLAVVAVPSAQLAPVTRALLKHGIRVLCEKPLAATAAEVLEAGRGVPDQCLGVVDNYRYRSDVRQARELLRHHVIGTPRFLRLERLDASHFPGRGRDPDWRRNGPISGCLIDNAYHWIYVAGELAGAPAVKVTARLAGSAPGHGEDLAQIMLDHANGALTSIQAAWCAADAAEVLEVHGDLGSLRLTGDCGRCLAVTSDGKQLPGQLGACHPEPGVTAMYREVLGSVRAGQPFAASARRCAEVLAIIQAARDSAREERTVQL